MKAIFTAALLLLVVLAGCQKNSCDDVGEKFIGLEGMNHWGGIPPSIPPQKIGEWIPKLSAVVATACTDDKWPAGARNCVMGSTDSTELVACDAKLGSDLMKQLSERMKPMVQQLRK